jgi:uncharacterized protein
MVMAVSDARLWAVLVVIALRTVLPEEFAFCGLLLALLGRRCGVLAGTLLSSGLFGLWHVAASLGGGPANAAIVGVVGGDAAGTVARVIATVRFTTLGGSCCVGFGCAAAACSLPSWPIGRSTRSVSS